MNENNIETYPPVSSNMAGENGPFSWVIFLFKPPFTSGIFQPAMIDDTREYCHHKRKAGPTALDRGEAPSEDFLRTDFHHDRSPIWNGKIYKMHMPPAFTDSLNSTFRNFIWPTPPHPLISEGNQPYFK